MNSFAPLKTTTIKHPATPWLNDEIINCFTLRDIAYRTYTHIRSVQNWEAFKAIRTHTCKLVKLAKLRHATEFLDVNIPNATLWRRLKTSGIVDSKRNDLDSSLFEANAINEFLTTSTHSTSLSLPLGNSASENRDGAFYFRNALAIEVERVVCEITSTAVGADGIPVKFLKCILPSALLPLTHIFNDCLTKSYFPREWKRALVLPLPKVHSPSSMADLRPISILSCTSKALERIMCNQMSTFINSNRCLSRFQSGFRPRHSTQTALVKITQDICESLEDKRQCTLVLLDLSKAFDSINHMLLCQKLKLLFNFSDSAVALIKSYLHERSQSVTLNGESSLEKELIRGTPQGSVLSPLLFSLFINDISDGLTCDYHLYADDLQIYASSPISKLDECFERINRDLTQIRLWTAANGLLLNAGKTQGIVIYKYQIDTGNLPLLRLGSEPISFHRCVKNLGVKLNNNFSAADHIDHVCARIYGSLRTLRSSNCYIPQHVRLKLIRSLILPHILYCSPLFTGMHDMYFNRLRVAFNSCLRYALNLSRYSHVSNHVTDFLKCSLENYLALRLVVFVRNVLVHQSPPYLCSYFAHGGSQRTMNLRMPSFSSDHMSRSAVVRGIRLWNALPAYLKRNMFANNFTDQCLAHFSSLNN